MGATRFDLGALGLEATEQDEEIADVLRRCGRDRLQGGDRGDGTNCKGVGRSERGDGMQVARIAWVVNGYPAIMRRKSFMMSSRWYGSLGLGSKVKCS